MKEVLSAFELCPLDGRYMEIKELLSPYFSEYSYMKYRVFVEIKWLLYILSKKIITGVSVDFEKVLNIYLQFDENSYLKIKEHEKVTNHDVKAVEYFLREELKQLDYQNLLPFIHFALTSDDVNNIAYALMIKDFKDNLYLPRMAKFLKQLKKMSAEYQSLAFLAHTHGQPATPTTVGKEFKVFWYRLEEEIKKLKKISIKAKLNGATGNYSAMLIAYPDMDVVSFSKEFIENELSLTFNPLTTQIENHDYIVSILDVVRHINNIILDLDMDMWLYISKGYFKLKVVSSEVGSSTMPHKVNPINFENSEANLETANSLLMMLSNKLPRSRMQRDLSDSSALRNLGISFGYSLQGIKSCSFGLYKVYPDKELIQNELDQEWEVLAEPIQTILRKYGIFDAYERLKKITRGKKISKDSLQAMIKELPISASDKKILLDLCPSTYIGLADKL